MRNNVKVWTIIWYVLILLLLTLYVDTFVHLKYGLQSVFDEGFYYFNFMSDDMFTVQTRPLSLSGELIKAVFPNIGTWDVLSLRRMAFGVKGLGIIVLLAGSIVFACHKNRDRQKSSLLVLIASVLLMGLFVIHSVVLNGNDVMLFIGTLVLSFCFLAVSFNNYWINAICIGIIGFLSFFAMLCNVLGGFMLCVLSILFLVLYNGFEKKKLLKVVIEISAGFVFGVLLMHLIVISLKDAVEFIKVALAQTTSGGVASHHSLSKLVVRYLLDARDLVMTLTMLCGISYLCGLVQHKMGKPWLTVVVGVVLFIILYKWQVKPVIKFASVITWIMLLSCISYKDVKRNGDSWNDVVLVLFLYLLPFGLAFGTNVGLLNKVEMYIVPWGVLLFVISDVTKYSSRLLSNGLLAFVFAMVLYGPVRGLMCRNHSNEGAFTKEYPIARMCLNDNQYAFYDEAYEILKNYDYQSRQDTILGFCFNTMTIVALDAVPYTNDQLPEEFLLHPRDKMIKPKFMILTEWDKIVLGKFFESLDWDFPDAYDCHKMDNNPDPNSGYNKTQSTLYCLSTRHNGAF